MFCLFLLILFSFIFHLFFECRISSFIFNHFNVYNDLSFDVDFNLCNFLFHEFGHLWTTLCSNLIFIFCALFFNIISVVTNKTDLFSFQLNKVFDSRILAYFFEVSNRFFSSVLFRGPIEDHDEVRGSNCFEALCNESHILCVIGIWSNLSKHHQGNHWDWWVIFHSFFVFVYPLG